MKAVKRNNYYDYPILTISKFLGNYYNVEGIGLNKLTHNQIKFMFDLKSYPYDKITSNNVISGKTLLVRDSEGVVLGYKNPFLNKSNEECFDVFESSTWLDVGRDLNKNIDLDDESLRCYSDYELGELIKACKKTNNDQIKNSVIKELHKRKQNNNLKEKKLEKIRKIELRKEW